jgi:glucose/arabinose dehydrogenase
MKMLDRWIAITAAGVVSACIWSGLALAQRPAAPVYPSVPSPDGPPLAASGKIYTDNCASCHGNDLSGGRGPSVFSEALLASRTDAALFKTIHEGVPAAGMPAFKGVISEPDTWQLINFLRTRSVALKGRPAIVADPSGQIIRSQKQAFRIEVVTAGLQTPWGLAFLPDGRMLVTERPGRLRIIQDGKLLPEPVKGTPRVWERQDAGMFDVVLHPDYKRNGWIYLGYAEAPGYTPPADPAAARRAPSPPNNTVIIRGKLNSRNEWVETQEIFRAPMSFYTPDGSHYGTRFIFDRQGYLYYSIGERGAPGHSQDLSSPLGKIHRVRGDGSVPPDNPFVKTPGAVPSIWTYGHRNPAGLTWAPATGLLWSSEHGPSGGDEVNIVEKGKNYGWGEITMGSQPGLTRRSAPGMEQPIVYYNPALAPGGMTFYAGDRYPGWKNDLFIAGLGGMQLRRLEVKGREVVAQEKLFDQFGRVRHVTVGPDGLLYVLLNQMRPPPAPGEPPVQAGAVLRLVPVS